MKKGTITILVIVVVLILIGIAYYIFVVRPSQLKTGSASETNGDGGDNSTITFTPSEKVYLNFDAPSPGAGYDAYDTVVYNTPAMGNTAFGKLSRNWYGNQPIGTVIQDLGDKVKVQVGMVSDFRVYPFTSSGYSPTSSLIIASGTGSKDLFFYKEYLTNVQY